MRTNTEPGSFFGENSGHSSSTFGITASTSDDLSLNLVDHRSGESFSIALTPACLDEFEALIGVCRAWLRSEERSEVNEPEYVYSPKEQSKVLIHD